MRHPAQADSLTGFKILFAQLATGLQIVITFVKLEFRINYS
jgi:hypothetical protein